MYLHLNVFISIFPKNISIFVTLIRLFMGAKILKISVYLYVILGYCISGYCQSLSGEVTTVDPVNNDLYGYYKGIAYNIIVASFFIQTVAVIYLVGKNSPKAKQKVIQLIIGIAFTGILWAVL